MKLQLNKISIYPLIFISILLALLPVILSDNYLRQDDLTFDAWPSMHFKQLGFLYYNGVFQVVRPIGAFFNYMTFKLSIDMHYAVYIRMVSVFMIGAMASLIYNWQCKFNTNKILAASFAIAAFTLPAWQIFAATANYICIIFAGLLAILSMFSWHKAYFTEDTKKQTFYRRLGYCLFFASLLDYPLSSMFAFTMIGIVFLNGKNSRFIIHSTKNVICMMVAYFILIKIVHLVFHVHLDQGRAATVDTNNLLSRFGFFIHFLGANGHLWFADSQSDNFIKTSLFIMFLLPWMASRKFYIPCGLFVLYFLIYSPTLAQPGINTFRYMLAIMPLVLYSFLWSFNTLFQSKKKNILPITTAIFGIIFSNIMLADGIVGPHTHDFNFIQNQIAEKVLPLIRENKFVVIHVVGNNSNFKYGDNIPTAIEYGLRIPHMPIMSVEAVSHSLVKYGYSSNFNRELKTKVDENNFVVTAPWGVMVANNDIKSMPFSAPNVIVIDLREVPTYQQFDFYKKLKSSLLAYM